MAAAAAAAAPTLLAWEVAVNNDRSTFTDSPSPESFGMLELSETAEKVSQLQNLPHVIFAIIVFYAIISRFTIFDTVKGQ